ncbi:MAG: hypothetical protein QQN63_12745 [Nitrosopumilus sp.]
MSIEERILNFDVRNVDWHTIDICRGICFAHLALFARIDDDDRAHFRTMCTIVETVCKANIFWRQRHGDVLKDRKDKDRYDKFHQLIRADTAEVALSFTQ